MTEKLRVIMRSTVTWLIFAGLVAQATVDELVEHVGGDVATWAGRVASVIGAAAVVAIGVIRRVSPVAPWERGVLPVDGRVAAQEALRAAGVPEDEIVRRTAGFSFGDFTLDDADG